MKLVYRDYVDRRSRAAASEHLHASTDARVRLRGDLRTAGYFLLTITTTMTIIIIVMKDLFNATAL